MSNCYYVLSYLTVFNGLRTNIFAVDNNGKNYLILSHKLRLTTNIKFKNPVVEKNDSTHPPCQRTVKMKTPETKREHVTRRPELLEPF